MVRSEYNGNTRRQAQEGGKGTHLQGRDTIMSQRIEEGWYRQGRRVGRLAGRDWYRQAGEQGIHTVWQQVPIITGRTPHNRR